MLTKDKLSQQCQLFAANSEAKSSHHLPRAMMDPITVTVSVVSPGLSMLKAPGFRKAVDLLTNTPCEYQ